MNEQRVKELRRIASENNGLLLPSAIVATAKNKKNVLHECFEWDDVIAGEKYRLEQARALIRITVQYLEENNDEPMKIFVSLTSDRQDGGYRELVNVLQNDALREQLLCDALAELHMFQQKYSQLVELSNVFQEIHRTEQKIKNGSTITTIHA